MDKVKEDMVVRKQEAMELRCPPLSSSAGLFFVR